MMDKKRKEKRPKNRMQETTFMHTSPLQNGFCFLKDITATVFFLSGHFNKWEIQDKFILEYKRVKIPQNQTSI